MKALVASTAVTALLAVCATSANAQYYQQAYAYPVYVSSYGYALQTPVAAVAPVVPVAQTPVTSAAQMVAVPVAPAVQAPMAQTVVVAAAPVTPVAQYAAPQAPVIPVRLRRGDDESAKRCAFADDSIGYALNNYTQLLHNQLPSEMAKYYGGQMYNQTYNLRNHIRAIKYSGNAAVCEYEGEVAIRTIQSIYQYAPR